MINCQYIFSLYFILSLVLTHSLFSILQISLGEIRYQFSTILHTTPRSQAMSFSPVSGLGSMVTFSGREGIKTIIHYCPMAHSCSTKL